MLILGIESSCDETGVALYDAAAERLLAHALHTQIRMHQAYGGVVPELASRDHIRRTTPLLRKVLRDSGHSLNDMDAIAYTQGPGLAGALLVGAAFAEGLASAWAFRSCRYIISKDIYSLPCFHSGHRPSPSLPCWFPAATVS